MPGAARRSTGRDPSAPLPFRRWLAARWVLATLCLGTLAQPQAVANATESDDTTFPAMKSKRVKSAQVNAKWTSPTPADSLEADSLNATDTPGESLPPFLADSVAYLWPTDASQYLSGTFGETRSAHLHTGIDIKTWGREGYRVFATRDAVLHRIQTGPGGYGNALYLRHDDGSFSVYAHLRNFIPRIERLADSLRLPLFSHALDARVDTLGIRFAQGDLIAYTGSTGVGPPHLHFEIRSAEQVPYNPLYARFPIQDTRNPSISMILAESIERLEDGQPAFDRVGERQTLRPQGRTAGGAIDFGELRMPGPLALSVDASDRADGVSNVYAVYRLSMEVDDSLRFSSRVDRLPFELASHMVVDRHYEWLRTRRTGLQRLHVRPANRLPLYVTSPGSGVLDEPPGRYRIRIEARDHSGNAQVGEFTWIATQDERIPGAESPSGSASVGVAEAGSTKSGMDEAGMDEVGMDEAGMTAGVGASSGMVPTGVEDGTTWTRARFDATLEPERRVLLRTPDERFWVDIPQGAAIENRPLRIRVETDSASQAVRFLVDGAPIPFVEPVQVMLHLPKSFGAETATAGNELTGIPGRPGLRRLRTDPVTGRVESGGGMWMARSGNTVGFRTTELSSFEVFLDTTRPSLSNPAPARGENRSRSLSVRAHDPQTPLDAASAAFWVDGVRGIPIFDPDRGLFLYHHPGKSVSGATCVEFAVSDVTGQRARQVWTKGSDARFEPAAEGSASCDAPPLRGPRSR